MSEPRCSAPFGSLTPEHREYDAAGWLTGTSPYKVHRQESQINAASFGATGSTMRPEQTLQRPAFGSSVGFHKQSSFTLPCTNTP